MNARVLLAAAIGALAVAAGVPAAADRIRSAAPKYAGKVRSAGPTRFWTPARPFRRCPRTGLKLRADW